MDVRDKLGEIRQTVERARAMPMSASCVINRAELLEQLDELAALLPEELAGARRILEQRDAVLEQGRAEATRIVEDGRREREALIHDTDVYRAAQYAADELRARSEQEALALRRETDDYVDQKLAGFEIALQKTLATALRGRERLGAITPPRGGNPEVRAVRQEVDEFVSHKLGRFEQLLRKSLDSVARGRERLRDRSGLDDYGVEEDAPPLPH